MCAPGRVFGAPAKRSGLARDIERCDIERWCRCRCKCWISVVRTAAAAAAAAAGKIRVPRVVGGGAIITVCIRVGGVCESRRLSKCGTIEKGGQASSKEGCQGCRKGEKGEREAAGGGSSGSSDYDSSSSTTTTTTTTSTSTREVKSVDQQQQQQQQQQQRIAKQHIYLLCRLCIECRLNSQNSGDGSIYLPGIIPGWTDPPVASLGLVTW